LLERFTVADGLQGSDFNFGASFRDGKGQIYFGGINGYNRFNPTFVEINLNPPAILLTDIRLAGSNTMPPFSAAEIQTLQLTHKDYFVVFTFSVMDFLDPEKNQYRYMLENFDPDWIDNGTRNTATYTNLPAGDYVFRVQGANSAGVWNREGISLIVRVLPPPWHTWWAYCLYGVGFLFFLWIFKRVYDSYVIKKRAIEMAIQMHETENRADDDMQEQLEQQDDLVKSVYRHNVATLALVSDYISRQSDYLPDDIAREATEGSIKRVAALSALEDCLYYQNDGLLADLHKYTDILISKLVSDASVRPDTIISINDVSTKLIAAEIASPLSIALYELLENCFQHAFELESPANYIHISLDIEPTDSPLDRCYRLVVRDNGVGCPGNIHPDTPETSGFATVHAIAEKLSGSLHISSDNGTTVTIVFVQTMPE
jgi:two-component sensor histidine kinase